MVDACRDHVTPIRGSILYTNLAFGYTDHSGIYIERNRIVELNSDGVIDIVTPDEFIDNGTGESSYASCYGTAPVGSDAVAQRAERMAGSKRGYNFIFNNCHQFTASCLMEEFENNISGVNYKRHKKYLHAD